MFPRVPMVEVRSCLWFDSLNFTLFCYITASFYLYIVCVCVWGGSYAWSWLSLRMLQKCPVSIYPVYLFSQTFAAFQWLPFTIAQVVLPFTVLHGRNVASHESLSPCVCMLWWLHIASSIHTCGPPQQRKRRFPHQSNEVSSCSRDFKASLGWASFHNVCSDIRRK